MKGKGLRLESIVEAATELIQERGYDNFSLRELALRLNVKAASLYNHIESVADINRAVAMLAAERLDAALSQAVGDKRRDEAFLAAALAYRRFARDNPELYRTVVGIPMLEGEGESLMDAGRLSFRALRDIVRQYALEEHSAVSFLRSLRSALHGFAALENNGYFSRPDVDVEESCRFMVEGFIRWANALEREEKGRMAHAAGAQ